MGTDYYLADPVAKEVTYVDRAGVHFCCTDPWPEYQPVDDWPHGPVRVLTPEIVAAAYADLEGYERQDLMVCRAFEFCAGRLIVLLVDDSSGADEASSNFCFQVVHGTAVENWTGTE